MRSKNDTLYEQLKALNVGDKISFPIERLTTIRTMSSNAAIMFGREHKTYSDREAKLVYVERTK